MVNAGALAFHQADEPYDPVALPTEADTDVDQEQAPDEEQEWEEEVVPNRSRLWLVAAVVFFLGLVASGVGCYLMYKKSETFRLAQIEAAAEADALRELKQALDGDLAEMRVLLTQQEEQLGGVNEALGEKEAQLVALQRRVNAAYSSGLKKGRAEAATASLAALQPQVDSLSRQLAAQAAQIGLLLTENSSLRDSLNAMRLQKQDLNAQIDGAAGLKVYGLLATALEEKKGNYLPVTRAKKTDRLAVNLVIAENKLAQAGPRLLHLVITDPKGEVLAADEAVFTNQANGKEGRFTQSQKVNYQQKAEKLQFVWEETGKYPAGSYRVEVFVDGYQMGTTTLNLQ